MRTEPAPSLPRWVRAADTAALALLLLGVSVMITGGFREPFLFGRVSVTSGLRPLALGMALLLLRHWAHRRPTVLARAQAWWDTVRTSETWVAVWPVFLSTRIGVLLVGFFAVGMIGYAPGTPPWRVYDNDLMNLPARWDTGWYMAIAERGYDWQPGHPGDMQNIAFFPAVPILVHYASLLLGRQTIWGGVAVSLIAFLIALHYLYRFAREKLGRDAAAAAVAFIAAYPFALFFSAAYTEAVFLLAAVAACHHFERGDLAAAAGWGLLAGLSRPNGCLLSIVLALLALRARRDRPWPHLASRLAAAAAPGIGMLIFSAYIYHLTGNPLEWAANHAAYGRTYKSVAALFADRVGYIEINGLHNYLTVLAHDFVNVVPALFALSAVIPVYRRLGAPYAAMVLVNVLLPMLMGGVLSMGRITSVLFPLFLWLGAAVPAAHRPAWLLAFAMGQALCAAAFFTWRPLV